MNTKSKLIEDILELKENISNEYISADEATTRLNEFMQFNNTDLTKSSEKKFSSLKSLLVIFNISNFSDMSILFALNNSVLKIIEESGEIALSNKTKEFMEDDPEFYKNIDNIEIEGLYYRLYYESMSINNTTYTLLSLTLSRNFRATRFHILCDIIMDYIRSTEEQKKGLFNDLFDYTVVELTKFISLFEESEPVVFFFRFEYISGFFNKMGLAAIIEMHHHIKNKFTELFGIGASIIRLSLSSYVVIAQHKEDGKHFGDMITKTKIDFSFKSILLPYTVIQVPYKKDNSIYDIFENVNLLNNYLRDGDLRI